MHRVLCSCVRGPFTLSLTLCCFWSTLSTVSVVPLSYPETQPQSSDTGTLLLQCDPLDPMIHDPILTRDESGSMGQEAES